MKRVIIILLCIFPLFAFSQKMFLTSNKFDADLKVYVTNLSEKCELKVYVTTNQYEVKNELSSGVWVYTKNKYDADYIIYFTDFEYEADLKIYFVNTKQKAGK